MSNNHKHLKYFQDYITKVNDLYRTDITTEHSFRGLLAILLEQIISVNTTKNTEIKYKVVNEPKRDTYGATDYIITKNDIPVGYLEAKDINATDLKGNKKNSGNKEQFDRYKKALGNIAFTNYTHFVFYIGEQFIDEVTLAEVFFSQEFQLNENEIDKFIRLFNDFIFNDIPTIKSPKRLSNLMAKKAKLLANVIEDALNSDEESRDNSKLHDLLSGFKDILIHDLSYRQFADVYAQTIAYGMFAARANNSEAENFDRIIAAQSISTSNPFLSDLFETISGIKIDPRIKWVVDDLADLFRVTDMKAILKKFGSLTKTQDPFIHFYEDFLADYDPTLRKQRGVWYTPEPVIKFIVRAVDDVLKTEFNLSEGIASDEKTTINVEVTGATQRTGRNKGKAIFEDKIVPKVQVLDPATGTGAFISEIIRYIYENKFENNAGMWQGYVKDNLLPRINGFELLMASYVIAHLKLEMLLKATGYTLEKDQRFKVYLTNSLEEHHVDTGSLFATFLSHEANEANYIKRDSPVMVVIGNPPYSGISSNNGEWISNLIEDYKYVNGEHFKERKHWLNDDYVKFIRYAEYFIEKNGEGVLAFINAHGFLDNPTFRGMRWHLLNTFDKIYTIDLHGNTLKNETSLDGSADENVFDIMQGVSINLFIKNDKKEKDELAKVYHYDLYGLREFKYDFLGSKRLKDINFTEVKYTNPMYFFIPKDEYGRNEYENGFSVNKLFTINSSGVITMADSFIISDERKVLLERIKDFSEKNYTEEQIKENFNLGKNYAGWIIENKERNLIDFDSLKPIKLSYRPFDDRYSFFNNKLIWRWRYKVMQNFVNYENIGLTLCRQFKTGNNFQHIFITKEVTESSYVSNRTSEIASLLPLYIYPDFTEQNNLDFDDLKKLRKPNLDLDITQRIIDGLGLTFVSDHEHEKASSTDVVTPLDILDYIYAILHSPIYRETYRELLKIDFPRIPYPTDKNVFFGLAKLGAELRETHLLENQLEVAVNFPITHDDIVINERNSKGVGFELHTSNDDMGRVWINDVQYFDNVSKIAWEFHIGGYQPAQKWLKDRNGVKLTYEYISHYKKIIAALVHTNSLMKKIDDILLLTE